MQHKKIALVSDAWVPQVNGVVRTFQSIIPILENKGFEIKILHPEMYNNFPTILLATYDPTGAGASGKIILFSFNFLSALIFFSFYFYRILFFSQSKLTPLPL